MKKIILLLTLLLTFNIVLAQDSYNDYSSLNINFNLDSNINLIGSGSLNKLTANVYLYPNKDERQEITYLNDFSTPQSKIDKKDYISYEWTEESSTYNFGYDSDIKTINKLYQVPETKIPYSNLDNEYQKYLQSEEITDITPAIISKTSEIIENQGNAYLAVHEIANWVHINIEYDLNTLTAKASKQSSWVLQNRQGVCDEITSLFISMTRSVGIPARFVSGMAYTNVDDSFGNHGWAEVYYPNYGWVPYDVTYGQFGWIDPTHIALQKSEDVGNSIVYQWKSSGDIQIDSNNEITTEAKIENLGIKINPIFDGSIKPLKNEVAPGSYVPIRIRIKNPYDAYMSDQIVITKAPDLTETNSKTIALKPLEKKDVFWIVKIPDHIQENYIYTTIIEFTDLFGLDDSSTISFSDLYDKMTLKEAEDMIDKLTPKEDNSYSNQIVLNCNPEKFYFYSFEKTKINCHIRTFNSNINDLSLCVEDSCENFDMPKNSEKDLTFELNSTKEILSVQLKNSEIEINRNILFSILEKPEIKINKIDLTQVNYGEDIDFPITISSETPLNNIKLKINRYIPITLEKLEGSEEFSISLNTKGFSSEKIKIKVEFYDEYNNFYEQEYQQDITVNNLPWYWKIINLFR